MVIQYGHPCDGMILPRQLIDVIAPETFTYDKKHSRQMLTHHSDQLRTFRERINGPVDRMDEAKANLVEREKLLNLADKVETINDKAAMSIRMNVVRLEGYLDGMLRDMHYQQEMQTWDREHHALKEFITKFSKTKSDNQ